MREVEFQRFNHGHGGHDKQPGPRTQAIEHGLSDSHPREALPKALQTQRHGNQERLSSQQPAVPAIFHCMNKS